MGSLYSMAPRMYVLVFMDLDSNMTRMGLHHMTHCWVLVCAWSVVFKEGKLARRDQIVFSEASHPRRDYFRFDYRMSLQLVWAF